MARSGLPWGWGPYPPPPLPPSTRGAWAAAYGQQGCATTPDWDRLDLRALVWLAQTNRLAQGVAGEAPASHWTAKGGGGGI